MCSEVFKIVISLSVGFVDIYIKLRDQEQGRVPCVAVSAGVTRICNTQVNSLLC